MKHATLLKNREKMRIQVVGLVGWGRRWFPAGRVRRSYRFFLEKILKAGIPFARRRALY
jgi:hypothetical protein